MTMPMYPPDDVLAARIVAAPGVLRAGAGCWDRGRTPIHPLTLESAYAAPDLLRALGARGARCAREFGVDVVVGAETGGVPLAAAVSSGASLERFAGELADEGADLAGAFVLVDMRDVAEAVTAVACSVPTDAVGTYLHLLDLAAAGGILD